MGHLFSVFAVLALFGAVFALGCNPGAVECVNSTSYRTCGEYAVWGEPVSCLVDQQCINGVCENRLGCQPGTRECINDYSYHVCGEHALWGPVQPCFSYQTCSAGYCTPEPQCPDYQQTRCSPSNPNQVQICNAQHQWEYYRNCDNGCQNGYCRACSPGSTRCSDSYRYQTCNGDGQWGPDSYCGANYVCRSGSCVISPLIQCTSIGAFRCAGGSSNILQRCGENYQWADFSYCQMGCFSGACRVCSIGETKCQDSQTYLRCTDNGQWGLATSCPNGYYCFAGSCQVPTGSQCSTVGQKRCSPTNSNMLQACGNNYVYQDYLSCPNGCVNGICAECKPGTSVCAGATTYRTCSDSGQLSEAKACTSGYTCDHGACIATPHCSEGQRNCVSDSVYSCVNGEWQLLFHCPSDTDCKVSSGTAYCEKEAQQNQSSGSQGGQQQGGKQEEQKQPAQQSTSSIEMLLAGTTIVFGAAAIYLFSRMKKK